MAEYKELKDYSSSELLKLAKTYVDLKNYKEALSIAAFALEKDPFNQYALFLIGSVYGKQHQDALAEVFYRRALEYDPRRTEIWSALGNSISGLDRYEEKVKHLKKSLQLDPEHSAAMVNLANAYLVNAEWDKAYYWANKAVEINDDSIGGHDNRGMAKLANGDWSGWADTYHALGYKYRLDIQYGEEPRWEGEKNKKVIIYGSQGIGDEILYGSCIPDAIKDCENVIIDCDPRLEGLFKRSFPEAYVYGTRRKEAKWVFKHTWDARCSVDVLPMFYRLNDDDFPGTPFLKACPVRRKQWRHTLNEMSDRPKIGIAWTGGGHMTGRERRSISVETFRILAEYGDLIDLEYEKHEHKDVPITRFDFATITDDYDDTAALVAELDYVVTVCTAMVHLCGGLGVPCHVLVPEKPSWRYAYDNMIWYDSVNLYHNKGNWDELMQEIIEDIKLRHVA